jgi:hypothetical protein
MKGNVSDFMGSWNVSWVTGRKNVLEQNYTMLIGTGGAYGDTPPALNPDNNVCVGFAVIDAEGVPVLSSGSYDPPLLLLYLCGGTLRWEGLYPAVGGQTLRFYVSTAEAFTAGDATTPPAASTSLYGTSIWGDPDQVGIWGAEGHPPPVPVS